MGTARPFPPATFGGPHTRHTGIDLHRTTVVIDAVDDAYRASEPACIACQDTAAHLRAAGQEE